jgi:hypothetical protein
MQTRLLDSAPKATVTLAQDPVLMLADVCFEMFSTRELRNPETVLPELDAAFPEITEEQKLKALSVALSWKRILRGASRLLQ